MVRDDSTLIQIVDAATAEAVRRGGDRVVCRPGCCDCCLGPFEITQLDAARLRSGLAEIDADRANRIVQRARAFSGSDDEPCPVLDPSAGTCELYAWRPVTCRVFGPPMQFRAGEISVCELCFQGASDAEIAACAVDLNTGPIEAELELPGGPTTVAASLLLPR